MGPSLPRGSTLFAILGLDGNCGSGSLGEASLLLSDDTLSLDRLRCYCCGASDSWDATALPVHSKNSAEHLLRGQSGEDTVPTSEETAG